MPRRSLRSPRNVRITALAMLVLLLPIGAARAAKTPEWVDRNGVSADYPAGRYLVGFAQATGKEDALESAKQQRRRISRARSRCRSSRAWST